MYVYIYICIYICIHGTNFKAHATNGDKTALLLGGTKVDCERQYMLTKILSMSIVRLRIYTQILHVLTVKSV